MSATGPQAIINDMCSKTKGLSVKHKVHLKSDVDKIRTEANKAIADSLKYFDPADSKSLQDYEDAAVRDIKRMASNEELEGFKSAYFELLCSLVDDLVSLRKKGHKYLNIKEILKPFLELEVE
jgi:hypothetical protein